MTLNLKIKNTNSAAYAARILRHETEVLRLEPGEEGTVSTWEGAPLSIVEALAKPIDVKPPTGE